MVAVPGPRPALVHLVQDRPRPRPGSSCQRGRAGHWSREGISIPSTGRAGRSRAIGAQGLGQQEGSGSTGSHTATAAQSSVAATLWVSLCSPVLRGPPTPFVSLTPLAPSPHTSSSTGPRSAWVRSKSQAGSPGGCWQDPTRVLQTWPGFVLRSARSLFLRPGQCGSNASPHLQNPQTLRKPFGNQGWGVFLF